MYTDNNPLVYVMSSAKLNASGLRWVGELADYHFTLKYKPGKRHGDADRLTHVSDESLSDLEKYRIVFVYLKQIVLHLLILISVSYTHLTLPTKA